MDDAALLRNFVEGRSDQAFGQLVSRHFDLVYCSALRIVGGDAHLAQDVAQQVFTDLARKAGKLPQSVVLGGWLYKHTCFTATNAVRSERRRGHRERQALEMTNDSTDSQRVWLRLAPILDKAMNSLNTTDRDAILLRFFERQPFRSVGDALGTSEEAARKRVDRALEKMRSYFMARGLRVSSMVLASAMEAHITTTAPAGSAGVVAAASFAASAKSSAAGHVLMKVMTLSKTQIATVALLAGLAATITVQSHNNAILREENLVLREQAALAGQLRAENERLRNQPAAPELLQNQARELARLRSEVGRLTDQLDVARKNPSHNLVGLANNRGGLGATAPPEPSNISYDMRLGADTFFPFYAKTVNEELNVPLNLLKTFPITLVTSNKLTQTEAINFLGAALKEQARITITRSANGKLAAVSDDPQNNGGDIKIYLPIEPPPTGPKPLRPGQHQIPAPGEM